MPLHAHEPKTLLPLLRSQLPQTIVFLASVLSNSELEPVYATFPPQADGSDITPEYLHSIGVGEFEWLVAVALPQPSDQLRIHHSLVSAPSGVQQVKLEVASKVVCSAIEEIFDRYPTQTSIGNAPELFGPAMRALVGAPKRDLTHVFAAPDNGFGPSTIDATEDMADLTLDVGRSEDAQLFYERSKYRSKEYYASRAPYTTLLRDAKGRPQVWVMTHGDGSIGALYTEPAYRRKGLAKLVLKRHVQREEERGVPRYCYIEDGNAASTALFESFGWRKIPGDVGWVYSEETAAKRHGV